MSERCWLLTGASGFLGDAILREIVRSDPGARVYATLRATAGELEGRAAALGWRTLAPRVVPVAADLTRLRLGLSPRDLGRLTSEVTHVIHAGATVRFDEPIHRARQVNAYGTRQVLELAQRTSRLERVVHVSTTFVCGDRAGLLVEGPATAGRFRNSYERTKLEAEDAVQRAMPHLPITVVRPSIVGPACPHADERARSAGETGEQQARFLLLLRLYLTHGWRWVPGTPASLVDMVPVDLVARGTLALARRPFGDGRWYHLAAGPRAATLRELGAIASRTFRVPPLGFAPPGLFRAATRCLVWGRARPMLERAAPFVPYLSVRTRVDTTDSQRVLRELGVVMPPVAAQFTALLARFATAGGPSQDVATAGATRPPARLSAPRAAGEDARRAAGRRS